MYHVTEHILFRKYAKLRLFTLCCVAHSRVTEYVIMLKEIFENISPESLYGKIAGYFFVIYRPNIFDVRKTRGH